MLSSSNLMSSNSSEDLPDQTLLLEVDDYLTFADEAEESSPCAPTTKQSQLTQVTDDRPIHKRKSAGRSQCSGSSSAKVAFKTKSELEILDDGYKWRKYGKKAVKSSPNPSDKCRNYYRCSNEGCHVKKRVERHSEDPSFVITTYDGVHNHHAPLPANPR